MDDWMAVWGNMIPDAKRLFERQWSLPDMRTTAGRNPVSLDHQERTVLRRLLISEMAKAAMVMETQRLAGGDTSSGEEWMERYESMLMKLGCRAIQPVTTDE